jgi:AraC-like DNA-binding protein
MALQLQPSHDNVTIEVQFSVFCAGHGQPPWAALPMPWLVADCDATSLAHLPGLMNRWRWRDDHTAMEARFVVNRLLWQMAHADDIPTTNADHPRPPQWLRDAITAADAKLKDPDFRVSGLARLAGVSENYLNRVVRQCYGRTAQALLRQMRIHRAQHMLEQNPEQSSKAIAARCGFSSTRQLRDAWQAETGSGLRQARQAAQGIISP